MFDIGMSEMVLLAIIGLIVIGPKQLPEVAAKLARVLNEFKRMTSDFTSEFTKTRDSATDFLTQTRNEINTVLQDKFSDQPNLTGLEDAKAEPLHSDLHESAESKAEDQMSFKIDERKDPNQNG